LSTPSRIRCSTTADAFDPQKLSRTSTGISITSTPWADDYWRRKRGTERLPNPQADLGVQHADAPGFKL
jgi:hypothetical protein